MVDEPRGRQVFDRWHLPVLMLLSCVVLFAGATTKELHGTPTFYASLVRELVETGDPLHIFRGAEAYFLKPPLVLWLTALSAEAFGLTNLGATFVSRLAGIAAVMLTYLLARRIAGPAAAWFAALVLLTNSTFVQFTTTLRMDSLLLAGMLLSLAGWVHAGRAWASPAVFAGLCIAVLSKGPPGFLAFALIALHVILVDRRTAARIEWRWSVLLLPVIAWYGYLLVEHGLQPVTDLAADAVRPDTGPASLRWWSYIDAYFVTPATRYWPWLPFMLAGIWIACRSALARGPARAGGRPETWLLAWLLLVLVLCAFKPDHDIRYLYIALPALAVLAALPLERLVRGPALAWAVAFAAALAVLGPIAAQAFGWVARDTRPTIAAMNAATDALIVEGARPVVLGEYPSVPGAPRRQNNQRDWIHFYLGCVPVIMSWQTAQAGGLAGASLVLLMRSGGYEQQLEALGFAPVHVTKEMVMGFRK